MNAHAMMCDTVASAYFMEHGPLTMPLVPSKEPAFPAIFQVRVCVCGGGGAELPAWPSFPCHLPATAFVVSAAATFMPACYCLGLALLMHSATALLMPPCLLLLMHCTTVTL